MPFSGQHPDQHGWPAPGAGPFEPFSYAGLVFPDGIAAGTGTLWAAVAALVVAHTPGGLYAPDSSRQITRANAQHWEQYGQELRQSRNSSNYSIHSWGLAVDFNSGHNPNQPDPPDPSSFRLPANMQDLLDALFGGGAFMWGGDPDWGSNKDWMHIECHLTPDEVAAWTAGHPGGATAPLRSLVPAAPTPPEDDMSQQDKDNIANLLARMKQAEANIQSVDSIAKAAANEDGSLDTRFNQLNVRIAALESRK